VTASALKRGRASSSFSQGTGGICRPLSSLCSLGAGTRLSHRITESQHGRGWQGPLGSPSPTPCPSRVTQSRLHSTASRRGWNIY